MNYYFIFFKEIWETDHPKYKIYWKYLLSFFRRQLYLDKDLNFNSVLEQENDDKNENEGVPNLVRTDQNNILDIEDFKFEKTTKGIETKEEAYKLIEMMKKYVIKTYPELTMPGNILYIYRFDDTNTTSSWSRFICEKLFFWSDLCKIQIDYRFRWAHQNEFTKIVTSSGMLLDHFPNNVDDALHYLSCQDI